MPKHLIIDTNLLLLWVIGALEEGRHIPNSKRLNDFTYADYHHLLRLVADFDKIFITPYIATEISNLIDLKGRARILAYEMARELFATFEKLPVDIDKDCQSDDFLTFGITDNALIQCATDFYILTNDYRILNALFQRSPDTIIPYSLKF